MASNSAPGMHGTMDGISRSVVHALAIGSSTRNEFSIFMSDVPPKYGRPCCIRQQATRGRCPTRADVQCVMHKNFRNDSTRPPLASSVLNSTERNYILLI